jgi:peptidoglycan/xylan/chitin deacetylase (PgdA/CDA1 family)
MALSLATLATGAGAASTSVAVPVRKAPEPGAEQRADRKAPSARCELADATALPEGFYRTDEWPKGEVVLTFDDGPHPGATPKVLKLLAKHRMPATFFVVGRAINAKTYALVQRMITEGHTLGTHSYNHDVGMAVRKNGERSIEYIRGQHETTQILIDLALVARSAADFDAMFVRVFEKKPGTYLPAGSLRSDWPSFAARSAALLAERGYDGAKRPYPTVLSRPPAGTPYVGGSDAEQKRLYGTALERAGLLNVMWHGESGDTNAEKRHDLAFLDGNLRYYSRRGGVILIHDYIRNDALAAALETIAKNPEIKVVPIEQAIERKFKCGSLELRTRLRARAAV